MFILCQLLIVACGLLIGYYIGRYVEKKNDYPF